LLKRLTDCLREYFRNKDDILTELAAKSEWLLKYMSYREPEIEEFGLFAKYVEVEELVSVHEPLTEPRLRHLQQICEIVS
jgi:hypothetical protein